MATEPIKNASTTETKPLDFTKAEERLKQVIAHLKNFEGKPGHNPFIYYNHKVQPLADRYNKGERTPELFKLLTELPLEAPTLDKLPNPVGAGIGQIPKPLK